MMAGALLVAIRWPSEGHRAVLSNKEKGATVISHVVTGSIVPELQEGHPFPVTETRHRFIVVSY